MKKARSVTDSLRVATKFGKRHDNVVRAIDALLESEAVQENIKSQLLNFEELEIIEKNGIGKSLYQEVLPNGP